MDIQTLAAALAIGERRTSSVIASEYSASETYALGDIVTHNGKLYECTTEISTAEEWTSSHWTQRTIEYFLRQMSTASVRFGVSGVGGSSPSLTRLWDSADFPTPTPSTDTTPGSSVFDAYAPFNRKK